MITSRSMTAEDIPTLLSSVCQDEWHKDDADPLAFWLESKTVCNVYEDEIGPVLFLRGKIVGECGMRLDIQFIDNSDGRRNIKCMLTGLPLLENIARQNNFQFFIFESRSSLLRRFCVKRLGFVEDMDNWLYKTLLDITSPECYNESN